jgi:hypothetical protein
MQIMPMTNEQILKLAKTCGYSVNIKTNQWECWEEQLIAFAQKIYQMGYDEGTYDTSIVMGDMYD